MFTPSALKQILNHNLSREQWINFRLHFEKAAEDDYRNNNAEFTRYPGVVPFHAWLCDVTRGVPYGVFALCHHQTAATAELAFRVEGECVRHIMHLAENLFSAAIPASSIMQHNWDGFISPSILKEPK